MKINQQTKAIVTGVATIIGLFSSLITFFTSSFTKSGLYLGLAILLLTLIFIFIFLRVLPKGNLPDGMEEIADEMNDTSKEKRIKVIFPCSHKYYIAANKLAKEKFGKNSVSSRTVTDWKNRNEFILTCLSHDNRMVGYFDILPLRTDFAIKLIDGESSEKDIRAENILGIHEMKSAEYLYFAGIAVCNTNSGEGYIHATYLVASAIQYIKKFYGESNVKKILTIPTSECGLKIATKHLNFFLEREGKLRKDGFDLYSKDFNLEEIINLINSKQKIYSRFDFSAYSLETIYKEHLDAVPSL